MSSVEGNIASSASERETRAKIDRQLRDAGWIADTEQLRFSIGARPKAGVNQAIAEWPTASGPADYVLFSGLTPLATVEAKRHITDIPGHILQAQRYSRAYIAGESDEMPGGPWGDFKIPFVFATNGRDFLRQIKEKSGIWFQDVRDVTNHPRPLEGWHSPEGLLAMLKIDETKATRSLRKTAVDLPGIREYQVEAIREVEKAIADGRREMLLAMATGKDDTLPKGFRWSELETKDGIPKLTFYRELLLHLGTKTKGRVQEIFADANTSLRQPRHLKELITQIDAIEWFEAREEGTLAELYEGLLEKNAQESKSGAGQYFTPRPLIECMVELIQPRAFFERR